MLLRRESLWKIVSNPSNADDMSDKDEEANEKDLATIVLTIEDCELVQVLGIMSAKEWWDALCAIHV